MIKLFVSDIDGTLLPKPHLYDKKTGGVSGEDLDALSDLKRSGVRLGLATGRHHTFLSTFDRHPNLLLPTVGFNGGYAWMDGRVLYDNPFPKEEVRAMIRDFPEIIHGFMGCTVENTWVYYTLEDCRRFYFQGRAEGRCGFERMYPLSLEEYLEDATVPPLSHIFISISPPHTVEQYRDILNAHYAGTGLRAVITSPRSVDFLRDGDSKAAGIGILAERMGLSMEEVAVVGDSYNDIEMFRAAGRSFCMAGAPEEVRRHAHQTVRGVAQAARVILAENRQAAAGKKKEA